MTQYSEVKPWSTMRPTELIHAWYSIVIVFLRAGNIRVAH